MDTPTFNNEMIANLADKCRALLQKLTPLQPPLNKKQQLICNIERRNKILLNSLILTAQGSLTEVSSATEILRKWMVDRTIVRVIGAGRAKLAGAIPANRLAHGGARLHIIDDLIPMPHTYRAGGIIAVSASGRTKTVLDALRSARDSESGITVVGIADDQSLEFKNLCDVFIGIRLDRAPNPLSALADIEEYVISLLLDSMVVAAGKLAGYDETTWKLGHENLGPTGPYDISRFSRLGALEQGISYNLHSWGAQGSKLINTLSELSTTHQKKILCVYGDAGSGKRSLCQSVFKANIPGLDDHQRLTLTAWGRAWREVAAQIVQKFRENTTFRLDKLLMTANEEWDGSIERNEDLIIKYASGTPVLLLIDNISDRDDDFIRFTNKWHNVGSSILLITTHGKAQNIGKIDMCEPFKLNPPKHEVIKEQLKKKYPKEMTVIDANDAMRILQGNPQKIEYLCYRVQTMSNDLQDCLERLTEDKELLLGALLQNFTDEHGLAEILALGCLRRPFFDEPLLRYLWDSLDRGGSQLYAKTLANLIERDILRYTGHGDQLELDPQVHAEVRKAFNNRLLWSRMDETDHFISQYYRKLFQDSFQTGVISPLDFQNLEMYVFHSCQCGNEDTVHNYLFHSQILERAFEAGLAAEIDNSLSQLEKRLTERIESTCETSDPEILDIRVRREEDNDLIFRLAQVLSERGRVCKDLNEHQKGLRYLDTALSYTNLLAPSYSDDLHKERVYSLNSLKSKIHHYRGIAFSQTGKVSDCIKAYHDAVNSGIESMQPDQRDALSLGYIAFELKFCDIERAIDIGHLSVEFAQKIEEQIDDKNVTVKNLVSLGQILAFGGRGAESRDIFSTTFDLISNAKVGDRELGRLFVDSAVTYISLEDWEEAEVLLRKADEVFQRSTDERRRYIGQAYRSIIMFRRFAASDNERKLAINMMKDAIDNHIKLGSIREAIYEGFTLYWMMDELPKTLVDVMQMLKITSFAMRDLSVFEEFWMRCYAPQLLGISAPLEHVKS